MSSRVPDGIQRRATAKTLVFSHASSLDDAEARLLDVEGERAFNDEVRVRHVAENGAARSGHAVASLERSRT
jgi:hypothetical protein